MSTEKLAEKMEGIILARIAGDKLALPVLPVIANKCIAALRDANLTVKRLTSIIEQDPVITAKILRLANTATYGGGGVRTLDAAVTRVGLAKLKTLLFELSARQVFVSKDSRIAKSTRSMWDHSLAVALIARDLCALSSKADEMDTAYLAGLLHDVGKPVVAAMLLEAEKMIAGGPGAGWINSDDWIVVVNKVHKPVAVALASKWALPEEVAITIKELADYDTAARQSASNFVRFANAVAKKEGLYAGTFDADDVEALVMIGRSLLDVNDELLSKLTGGLKERVAAQGD